MSRADEYSIRVSVDGTSLGTFDKLTGGEVDSEETTYKPGAMGARIALGGSQNVGNVVVSALYDLSRLHSIIHWLMSRAGKGHVVITKQPLDVDSNAVGRAITYQGTLKRVSPPEVDSESSAAALLELEMTSSGTIA